MSAMAAAKANTGRTSITIIATSPWGGPLGRKSLAERVARALPNTPGTPDSYWIIPLAYDQLRSAQQTQSVVREIEKIFQINANRRLQLSA
jgi:hypothetical protein